MTVGSGQVEPCTSFPTSRLHNEKTVAPARERATWYRSSSSGSIVGMLRFYLNFITFHVRCFWAYELCMICSTIGLLRYSAMCTRDTPQSDRISPSTAYRVYTTWTQCSPHPPPLRHNSHFVHIFLPRIIHVNFCCPFGFYSRINNESATLMVRLRIIYNYYFRHASVCYIIPAYTRVVQSNS